MTTYIYINIYIDFYRDFNPGSPLSGLLVNRFNHGRQFCSPTWCFISCRLDFSSGRERRRQPLLRRSAISKCDRHSTSKSMHRCRATGGEHQLLALSAPHFVDIRTHIFLSARHATPTSAGRVLYRNRVPRRRRRLDGIS